MTPLPRWREESLRYKAIGRRTKRDEEPSKVAHQLQTIALFVSNGWHESSGGCTGCATCRACRCRGWIEAADELD